MKKLICILFLGGAITTGTYAARGDGSLILSVAGIVNDNVDELRSDNKNDDLNYGAGAMVESNINDYFGIEVGALLVERNYRYEAGAFEAIQRVRRLHVPVLARFWMSDYFSVAAGPFVAFKTGDVETELNVGETELGTVETSADDSTEYGVDAAATFNLAVNDKTGIFVEGRYSTYLDEKNDEDTNHLAALAGLKFDL